MTVQRDEHGRIIFADLIRQLPAALRSGQYEQGREALRLRCEGRDTFCCLGVALDQADPQGWEIWDEDEETEVETYVKFSDEDVTFGEGELAEWLSVPESFGAAGSLPEAAILAVKNDARWDRMTSGCPEHPSLAHLNDGGWSFAEIADIIEAYFIPVYCE